jgi:predicted small secreted protein
MKNTRLAAAAMLALSLLSAVALSACNTTEGFGQDVKNAGQDISSSAQQNK